MQDKVVITGISGMIGSALGKLLISEGYEVIGLSRRPEQLADLADLGVNLIRWNGSCPDAWLQAASGAYAIINLAGENIAGSRWTENQKNKILQSRLHAIQSVQDAITLAEVKPRLFVQASATGYYGINAGQPTDENRDSGEGFLASVCVELERETANTDHTRVVVARFGVVLDKHSGALAKMVAPMKFGICGYPGSGRNYIPWIHLRDLVNALLFIIRNDNPLPVYNLAAPQPVRMKTLVATAARYKNTLPCLPVPPFFLAIPFGKEMVEETLMSSQQIIPAALNSQGFSFRFEDIRSALADIFSD
ncbi:MAG: TIGR01777 family oxidoreductase [Bacteroidales bacterium]